MNRRIAVIDTETNYEDEVISIGVAIANDKYKLIDTLYLIIYPECEKPAMYASQLYHPSTKANLASYRVDVIENLKKFLDKYDVDSLYAYNANFDKGHLRELNNYNWYDIMKVAAYKQYNNTITEFDYVCKTGRLKSGYGVEEILNRLRSKYHKKSYSEVHNALSDSIDELEVMELLGHGLDVYEVARI